MDQNNYNMDPNYSMYYKSHGYDHAHAGYGGHASHATAHAQQHYQGYNTGMYPPQHSHAEPPMKGSGEGSKIPCKFWLFFGHCTQQASCPYAHQFERPHAFPYQLRALVCTPWLENRCAFRQNCHFAHGIRYVHPDSFNGLKYVEKKKRNFLCTRWLFGECQEPFFKCPFAHGIKNLTHHQKDSPLGYCTFWMFNGFCKSERDCQYKHSILAKERAMALGITPGAIGFSNIGEKRKMRGSGDDFEGKRRRTGVSNSNSNRHYRMNFINTFMDSQKIIYKLIPFLTLHEIVNLSECCKALKAELHSSKSWKIIATQKHGLMYTASQLNKIKNSEKIEEADCDDATEVPNSIALWRGVCTTVCLALQRNQMIRSLTHLMNSSDSKSVTDLMAEASASFGIMPSSFRFTKALKLNVYGTPVTDLLLCAQDDEGFSFADIPESEKKPGHKLFLYKQDRARTPPTNENGSTSINDAVIVYSAVTPSQCKISITGEYGDLFMSIQDDALEDPYELKFPIEIVEQEAKILAYSICAILENCIAESNSAIERIAIDNVIPFATSLLNYYASLNAIAVASGGYFALGGILLYMIIITTIDQPTKL